MQRVARFVLALVWLGSSVVMDVGAHMAITNPAARQVINGVGLIIGSYTTFAGPGDVWNLDANVLAGPSGAAQIQQYGYGLCGDDGRRKAFSIPSTFGYAPTATQMTIGAGSTFEVTIQVTAYHYGWFEFRLCAPSAGQKVVVADTAECFRQHVLALDPQQYYTSADMNVGIASVFDFVGSAEAGYNFQHAKCQQGPPNTCCDPDSGCSPESANINRFVLPRSGVDNNVFRIRLVMPSDVSCEQCTFQVTYRTGNSPDSVSTHNSSVYVVLTREHCSTLRHFGTVPMLP